MLNFETSESVISNFSLPSDTLWSALDFVVVNALKRPLLISYFKEEKQCFFSFQLLKLLFLATPTTLLTAGEFPQLHCSMCRKILWLYHYTHARNALFNYRTPSVLSCMAVQNMTYQAMPFINIKILKSTHILRSVASIYFSFILLPSLPLTYTSSACFKCLPEEKLN